MHADICRSSGATTAYGFPIPRESRLMRRYHALQLRSAKVLVGGLVVADLVYRRRVSHQLERFVCSQLCSPRLVGT